MKISPRGILARCMVVLMLTVIVFPGAVQAGDQPIITLEQAIRAVKDNFPIPQEYNNFTSSFENYNNNPVWSLNWNDPKASVGNIQARVDGSSGEVLGVDCWQADSNTNPGLRLPSITVDQARDQAVKLLNILNSGKLSQLQLVSNGEQNISTYGPALFTFSWQRMVDAIPYWGDGVTIKVRGDDGTISNYNMVWSKGVLSVPAGTISADKASQAFMDANMLELQYYQANTFRPLAVGEKPQIKLIYQLNHPSNGFIDALSGQPFVTSGQYYYGGIAGGGGGMGEMLSYGKNRQDSIIEPIPLSPEEIKEIENTSRLISREEAVTAVKKWVDIPDILVQQGASLTTYWASPEIRIWNLNWGSDSKTNLPVRFVNATVNAGSGELINFNWSGDSYSSQTKAEPMDRQHAQVIADKFLAAIQPQRIQDVKLTDQSDRLMEAKLETVSKLPEMQYFNYQRLVNGISCPFNSISISVDAINGKVTGYQLNWQDLDFPPADNILTRQQAANAFLNKRPLTLCFFNINNSNGQTESHLVYMPQFQSDGSAYNTLDAVTGDLLDWAGNPVADNHKNQGFTDITDSFAAQEISLLGKTGVFTEYGDAFHPDENITVISLLRAMLILGNGGAVSPPPSDDEVMSQAKNLGWLKEDLQPGDNISREMLAKFMVRLLKIEPAARATGIYQVKYADAASILPESLAYAALMQGLGIIKGDGVNFEAGHITSRAEAAAVLVRALLVR